MGSVHNQKFKMPKQLGEAQADIKPLGAIWTPVAITFKILELSQVER